MRWFRVAICIVFFALLAQAAPRYMFLTVTDFEAGISYRQAQWHAPIGYLVNPCAYADHFTATIDWGDGAGEHTPDTNVEKKSIQNVPAVPSGTYLFWDDEHVSNTVGTQIVITKLVVHCAGDPPGDHEYVYRNVVTVHPRIPVNQVEFTHHGKGVSTVKGHDSVDLAITLDAPAPRSGTWVKLDVTPPGNLNTLPPYVQIPAGETQETIPNLELRKPDANFQVQVTASTVGRAQESQKLTVTP